MEHHVACLQTRPAFGEVRANLDAVEARLAGTRADLVVLPELFATGYAFRTRDEAYDLSEAWPEGATTERLCAVSEGTGGMVVGGLLERDGDRLFNSAAVVVAGRPVLRYRKIHLFGFESETFTPGDGPLPVLEHRGLRVGVMICFDWMFPEAARVLALAGADVIAHPSNLVLQWCQRAMRTRALENGLYAITANRVGTERRPPRPELAFTGHSVVVDPLGELLAEGPADDEVLLEATVDVVRARDKHVASGNDRIAERRPEWYATLLRADTSP